jgi:hypothetical protein
MLATERPLAEAIADYTGTDIDRDLYPTLAAATVVSALRATIEFWLGASGPPQSLRNLLTRAIADTIPPLPAHRNVKEPTDDA